jgi:hypothetical protein
MGHIWSALYINGLGEQYGGATVCITHCLAQRVGVFPLHCTNDRPPAGSSQDYEPVLIHVLLDRDNRIGRYRYINPHALLVGDVRREHLDMRDGWADAWGCKQWGVGLMHTLLF